MARLRFRYSPRIVDGFLFGPSSLGEIAGDLGETDEGSRLIPDRSDDDVGPEVRPIFSQSRSFLLESPLSRGDFQFVLRVADRDVFGPVKDREMPADDFVGGVALDSLGAPVPARDIPTGIQHEDGVVVDRFDHELVHPPTVLDRVR